MPPKQPSRYPPDHGQVSIRLSAEAWETFKGYVVEYGYSGRARQHGVGAFLVGLFSTNPSPTHWTDERPPTLREFDVPRLMADKLPIWIPDHVLGRRRMRWISADRLAVIEPYLLKLSETFGIVSQGGHQMNPRSRATATLEVIGLGYLKFANKPQTCASPRNEQRSRAESKARKGKAFELSF